METKTMPYQNEDPEKRKEPYCPECVQKGLTPTGCMICKGVGMILDDMKDMEDREIPNEDWMDREDEKRALEDMEDPPRARRNRTALENMIGMFC